MLIADKGRRDAVTSLHKRINDAIIALRMPQGGATSLEDVWKFVDSNQNLAYKEALNKLLCSLGLNKGSLETHARDLRDAIVQSGPNTEHPGKQDLSVVVEIFEGLSKRAQTQQCSKKDATINDNEQLRLFKQHWRLILKEVALCLKEYGLQKDSEHLVKLLRADNYFKQLVKKITNSFSSKSKVGATSSSFGGDSDSVGAENSAKIAPSELSDDSGRCEDESRASLVKLNSATDTSLCAEIKKGGNAAACPNNLRRVFCL